MLRNHIPEWFSFVVIIVLLILAVIILTHMLPAQNPGREINPTVYTPAEFDTKRVANDSFPKQKLDKPKLFVVGKSDELGKVAGE